MLRADIGVAEFVGCHESAAECVLDAGRHADSRPRTASRTLGFRRFGLPLEVIDLDLGLPEDGLHHVAVGERQQQVFGIDLQGGPSRRMFGGLPQQSLGLFADTAGQPHCRACAVVPAAAGAGSPSEAWTTSSVSVAMDGASSPMREEVAAKEVFETARRAQAEQGFQR